MKKVFASYGTQFSGRRETARSRGAPLNDVPRKQQRAGEEEKAADADVTDLIAQVHLKLSTQLEERVRDLESPTYSTLCLPKESDIVTEIQNAGRYYSDMVENQPSAERGSPHIWFFNAMLKATERILKIKIGELNSPGQGKADALRTLRMITDERKFHELSTWIKACRHLPTFVRHGQIPRSRIGEERNLPSRRWRTHWQRRTEHNTRGV